MQKWEYAELSYDPNTGMFDHPDRYLLTIYKTSNSSIFDIRQDKTRGDKSLEDARSRTVAQLGLDGWELVSVGYYAGMKLLLFKRPLP